MPTRLLAQLGCLQGGELDGLVELAGHRCIGPAADGRQLEADQAIARAQGGLVELGHFGGKVRAIGGGERGPGAVAEVEREGVDRLAIDGDACGLVLAR